MVILHRQPRFAPVAPRRNAAGPFSLQQPLAAGIPGRKFVFRLAALAALISICLLAASCHRADVHSTLRKHLPQAQAPQVLAVYEPWFGDRDHIDIGYSSHDRVVLRRQVEKAKDLGITGFVVDWYGSRKPFLDTAYGLLQQVSAESGFKVALMYDEPEDAADHATDYALSSLQYAYERYIGPDAPHRSAYLTYDGRPVVFVWPRNKSTDWQRIRQFVNTWQPAPLLIMEDGDMRQAEQFDGFYAWVQPGERGWQADGSNRGIEYLDGFYRRMKKYPGKIAVGAAWPGFDDSRASWGQNRYMDARCGKTFEETLRLFRRYYDNSNPLPFLLVITWNDYEEGTAIEAGVGQCGNRPAKQNVNTD